MVNGGENDPKSTPLEGDRAPWLERLGDKILGIEPTRSEPIGDWRGLALEKKQRVQELLHRELSYSGIINEEMSYSALPLAIIAFEDQRH
jgi:hypothetical protein